MSTPVIIIVHYDSLYAFYFTTQESTKCLKASEMKGIYAGLVYYIWLGVSKVEKKH